MDITPTTFRQTAANKHTLYQLLKIALFDFWCANEDRTYNKVVAKISELLSEQWVSATWNNFVECLKSNSNYGK